MKAFKYMMMDISRTKAQIWCMLLFGFLAFGFSSTSGSMISGMCYLMFAAVIMDGAVFTYEQKHETGFVNMLPGTELDRSAGRFLTGIFFLTYGMVLALVAAIVLVVKDNQKIDYIPEQLIIFMGIGLIFIAVQNVLFYVLGKGNSQQLMSFIHMLPGFLIYLLLSVFTTMFSMGEGESILLVETLERIEWIKSNFMLFSIMILLLGCIFTISGIFVTKKIMSKKDFA